MWRLQTGSGPLILKQTSPAHRNELAVHLFCSRIAPDMVDAPIAIDLPNCRMLLPDRGPTLLDTRPDSLPAAINMIRDYAQLQLITTRHHREARVADIPIWDAASAETELRGQIATLRGLPHSDIRHITGHQASRLASRLQTVGNAVQTLDASVVPHGIDHGDLWPGNVLPSTDNHRHRFIDFGDAAWTHPFISLQSFLHYHHRRRLNPSHNFDTRAPQFHDLLEAYLQPWHRYGAPAQLTRDLQAAACLSPLRRSRAAIDNFDHVSQYDAHDLGPTPYQWLTSIPEYR